MQFSGALTALVTPFRNNELDEEAYRAFIEHQINEGIPVSADEVMLFHEDLQRLERKSVRTESLLLFVIERICLLEHVQVGFVVHVKHRQEEF